MAIQYIPGVCLMLFASLLNVTRASVCDDNRGSSPLISGANSNVVNNFLQILRRTNTFLLVGDNISYDQGCRKHIGQYLHRTGLLVNDTMWILDCWEPSECTLEKVKEHNWIFLRLVQKSWLPLRSLVRTQVNTVLLPIDERDTISYTFLPYVSQRSVLFVTALLSGCSVFVATPDNINCNVIVMHANRFCRSTEEDDDDNHKQATFVLQQVHSTNQQCRYQIQRRWACDYKRANIESHNYHYSNNIVYYRLDANYNFVYGYNLGGNGRKWQFCLKEVNNSPHPEICNDIV